MPLTFVTWLYLTGENCRIIAFDADDKTNYTAKQYSLKKLTET